MLALIAGRGQLPSVVAKSLSTRPLVCSLEGNNPEELTCDICFRLETLGSLLQDLRERGVEAVCFCGAVSRPRIEFERIDAATMPLAEVLQRMLRPGDDGALRAVIGIFEDYGFNVCAAHEIAPELLPPVGVLSHRQPDIDLSDCIKVAMQAFREMSDADEGQACVVFGQEVMAKEDARGTDAMLQELAKDRRAPEPAASDPFFWAVDQFSASLDSVADWLSGPTSKSALPLGHNGILLKAPKRNQDLRVDLPTIGLNTIEGVIRAGLKGMVLQRGRVIVLELDQVIHLCDQYNLFLVVSDMA
ncbi:MAG: UDP-2,3-diacylglucosamine diphosphatase LpxI [Aestuariivita sp.]|nr:UDP-2,3-diacylglucosamine diphosphatase LpxI [Aestuariivita sp.]MCY4345983.1 UDP-2,3-diacylglucosamine diphosphatase LpxI [Aestuariivita sp.]